MHLSTRSHSRRPTPQSMCVWLVFATGCAQALAQASLVPEPISLPWTERKPFQYQEADGKLRGILYELGEAIFSKAGVPRNWVQTPAARISRTLIADEESVCLVGWFRTPEREKIAKISLPIYQDQPQRAVVRADSRISGAQGLAALLEDRRLKLIVKQGYSYGAVFDSLIATRKGEGVETVLVDHAKMLEMLLRARADMIFLTGEEIDHYSAINPLFTSQYKVISFKEFPAGNQRHILCSKHVSDEAMGKLDAAIRSLIKLKSD